MLLVFRTWKMSLITQWMYLLKHFWNSSYKAVLISCFLPPGNCETRMTPGSVMTNWQFDWLYSCRETGRVKGQTLTAWCVCVHVCTSLCVYVCVRVLLGVGVMNLEPCVQLTSTLSTDCLVTEHMISVLTQHCVMKPGGAHSRGQTVWLTGTLQILLPIFRFH